MLGAIIGAQVGGVIGIFNPAIFDSVYPEEWKQPYHTNGAVLFITGGYGVVGGMVGGSISDFTIRDNGIIGGAVGGTLASVYSIYKLFLDNQQPK